MLQFFGLEKVNPTHLKNATIFMGWKVLTLSLPKMLEFFFWGGEGGLAKFNPFQPPKIVAYVKQN
jgi:hypothetical protein